ncbi:LysR family transcriptional regulator [Sphingopyxis yananensis]|uniref:LysR family transcriptional regulator n=1 Tax=Sphingopyxis yananensis TaxID=2886687 RepID=UPI002A59C179|nr:LysR family transcriptional regulator [Sphingopyxis yananensis]
MQIKTAYLQHMNWDRLQYFLTVAQHGTLARAAQALKVDATTVSRQISALENQLGERLFERSPAGFLLSSAGRDLMPHAEAMASAAARIDLDTPQNRGSNISGQLRVSLSEGFGSHFVASRLHDFLHAHPALEVDLVASSGFLNPSRREADLAILLAQPRKGPLITRRIANYQLALYAPTSRPDWHSWSSDTRISTSGIPIVGYIPDILYAPELDYLEEIEPGLKATARSSSIIAQSHMIASGAGIGVLPCFLAADHPDLHPIWPDKRLQRSFWLTLHQDLVHQPRVRAFIDWIENQIWQGRHLLNPSPN